MPDVSSLNPLNLIGAGDFDIGIGTIGNLLILLLIGFLIAGLMGFLIWKWWDKKMYKIRIPLYSLIGNKPTRIGTYKAKPISMGMAGDKLWFVRGAKKYIPPATIQTASNEFWHWIREDGEWINFSMDNLDEKMKKAGIRFIQEDMRLQRLATDRLLEQRLLNKGFWEKWGVVIGYVIFFLVITVSMIVIFYQYSGVVEKTAMLIDKIDLILQRESNQGESLVPALVLPFLLVSKIRRKINVIRS